MIINETIDENEQISAPSATRSHVQKRSNGTYLQNQIKKFSPITLDDIQNIALMDRVDTKFVFHKSAFIELISKLSKHYNILEINNNRIFTYQNVYWDTPDMLFYHSHHNGKLNRYKVRYRKYKETQTAFLELKFKTNKKRTIKERIGIKHLFKQLPAAEFDFLAERLPEDFHNLKPILFGIYKRITFVNKDYPERVTIDFDLNFRCPDTGERIALSNLVVAEVKQSKTSQDSKFINIMRRSRVRPTSFSKYCIGCCLVLPQKIKTNKFKMKLKQVNNIESRNTLNGKYIAV